MDLVSVLRAHVVPADVLILPHHVERVGQRIILHLLEAVGTRCQQG